MTGHDPAHMMVLCPNCHDLATAGALPEAEQRSLKRTPFNRKRGFVNGELYATQEQLLVALGSNLVVGPGYKIRVDEQTLLGVRRAPDGTIALTVSIYDKRGVQLLEVRDNEWISGSVDDIDCELRSNFVRLQDRNATTKITIDLRKIPARVSGTLQYQGIRLDAGGSFLSVPDPWRYAFTGLALFDAGFYFSSNPKEFRIGNIEMGLDYPWGLYAMSHPENLGAEIPRVVKEYAAYRRRQREREP